MSNPETTDLPTRLRAVWDGSTAFDMCHEAADEIERLRAALEWYGENARLARLIHSEGDKGRHALSDDGGKRAKEVLHG